MTDTTGPSALDAVLAAENALIQGRIERRQFLHIAALAGIASSGAIGRAAFAEAARDNQMQLGAALRKQYDYIICGAGSSGSVVARRLAENPAVRVLLLEAGGSDQVPSVTNPGIWFTNLGSERDWGFKGEPNPKINNRQIPLSMGKVLGGGSSINVMIWSRGHKNDWDYFASESGDQRWSYENVLGIYRRIEDYQGPADALRRGKGGLVYVGETPNPSPIAPAMLESCRGVGIPTFPDQNAVLMEGVGGAAIPNVRYKPGERLNVFGTYVRPILDRPNITVLTHAAIRKLTIKGTRVTGVEFTYGGKLVTIAASREVILSTGAINTPKILMQSGIGEAAQLRKHGIPVVADLPGVGKNFQDHVMVAGCVWEYNQPIAPRNNAAEATFFWKSDSRLDTPDLQPFQIEIPYVSEVTGKQYNPPAGSWSLSPAVVRPKSRGEVTISGTNPDDPVRIAANTFAEPDDMTAMLRCIELCREIGNSGPLAKFNKREVMPGKITGADLQNFARDAAVTYWHQSCTAKMGRDAMSVVDGQLRVHGIQGLRIADASVMPRVTTGNTMAGCVVIGEQAATFIKGTSA
ncbi:GMC family oxidoreductase N-terminal domain-containing protein [Sphingomonas sp. 4RDLI-65]|uniref:GMC family oxidoreductase n=1 Tax=Sphingomonas sp. 4RDLI-65 TaxID=3111641 RepID=UPI003C1CB6A9